MTKINIITILCTWLITTAGSWSLAQETPGSYLQEQRNLTESIESTEQLLAKYPTNDFTPTLMFQLSELYIKRSTLKYQQEMLIYEEAEESFSLGARENEPEIPQVDFKDATRISLQLLQKFPAVYFRDKVLYRVALCYSEEGNQGEAVKYFHKLAKETDDKLLLEEAYFRLGEYYFDKKDFLSTIDFYSRLLESWDSPFFDMALYKLGWSYYSVENYGKAISTFIYLIEDIKLLDKVGADELGKSKADLRREAIEYIAICFSEYGGAEKARKFLLPKKEKDYTEAVLVHLAGLYRKRDYYVDAIATLRILIGFYPNKTTAAFYQKQIVENYDLAGDKDKANQNRLKLVETYGPGSGWLQFIPDSPERNEIISIAEGFIYQLGSEAQQKAQSAKDSLNYETAIALYTTYMAKFPSHERAHKVQFYLAECFYELSKYHEAANAYYELHLNYPESEFSETAAYNRILAFNHLLRDNSATDSTDFFLFNFLGKSKTGVEILKALNGSQAQLLQASNDYFIFFSKSPKVPEVLMNLALILFGLEQFDMAKEVYQEVMARTEENSYLTQAFYMMAQCEFRQDHFDAAQEWYQKVIHLFPDSVRFVKQANKMIALSQFRRAEAYLAGGDSLLAAEEFERVATSAPDSAIAERALFEAARQFEIIGDKAKAIVLYESMSANFPNSELLEQALFKAGLLSEDKQYWHRAATNYLGIYHLDRFSELAPKSLFFAAKCYENLQRYDLARNYFQEYIDAYIQDPDRYLEAAFRKGEIAFNQEQIKHALKDLHFVLSAYKKYQKAGVSVEAYIPANALFLIAEISFKTFKQIELTPPLKRKLKRKKSMFRKVIKAYTAAAKLKVAEWTTASSYKIGLTFEAFADALAHSPRPKNLSPENLVKYNQKLQERVLPFKQKALETYAANIKNAEQNNIDNEWIAESRKRIEALSGELGLTQLSVGEDTDS